MNEPLWVTKRDALAIHDMQIAEHGGLPGIREDGLLESALGRPENLFAYGEPDLCDLGAAYAYGIAKNHPFADGNKRTSLGVCLAFLDVNGLTLPVEDEETIATWTALAAGEIAEADLAAWLRARVRQFIIKVRGEGDIVQRELIERIPVPTIYGDGWEFEGIVDGVAHLVTYTEHMRDDGQVVRVVQQRLACPPKVLVEMLREIAEVLGMTRDELES